MFLLELRYHYIITLITLFLCYFLDTNISIVDLSSMFLIGLVGHPWYMFIPRSLLATILFVVPVSPREYAERCACLQAFSWSAHGRMNIDFGNDEISWICRCSIIIVHTECSRYNYEIVDKTESNIEHNKWIVIDQQMWSNTRQRGWHMHTRILVLSSRSRNSWIRSCRQLRSNWSVFPGPWQMRHVSRWRA